MCLGPDDWGLGVELDINYYLNMVGLGISGAGMG